MTAKTGPLWNVHTQVSDTVFAGCAVVMVAATVTCHRKLKLGCTLLGVCLNSSSACSFYSSQQISTKTSRFNRNDLKTCYGWVWASGSQHGLATPSLAPLFCLHCVCLSANFVWAMWAIWSRRSPSHIRHAHRLCLQCYKIICVQQDHTGNTVHTVKCYITKKLLLHSLTMAETLVGKYVCKNDGGWIKISIHNHPV